MEETYKELAKQVKVDGFRKGKVPRQLIDAQLGKDAVRREALQRGMATLYVMAVADSGILPVSDPEIAVLEEKEDGSLTFEAKVDVKPEVTVKDYMGIEIEKPDTEATDEDLERALEQARDRFATLEIVDLRPVQEGDFVMFDYKVFADGVPVEGSSGNDLMLEVGSGDFLPGFDEQLVGSRKGDILDVIITFPPEYEVRELAGKPATYRTIIKELKTKVLPDLDDALAKEISSCETLDEFKQDLRARIQKMKEMQADREVRERVVQVLADNTYIDLPESMIQRQIDQEIEEFAGQLEERGITLDQYLEAMKGSRYQLENAIRERVIESLKGELVVDAVAQAEDVQVSDEEAEQYIRENAMAAGGDPDELLKEVRKRGRIPAIKGNLRLAKAVDLMAEAAVFKGEAATGPEGVVLTRKPEGEAEAGEPETEAEEAAGEPVEQLAAVEAAEEPVVEDAAAEEQPAEGGEEEGS